VTVVPTSNGTGNGTAAPVALTNGTWEWNATLSAGAAAEKAILDQANHTVAFGADGKYTIKVDCYGGTGTYNVSGSTITVMPADVTVVPCGNVTHEQDDKLITGVSNATSWEIDAKGRLALTLVSGERFFFMKAAGTPAPVKPTSLGDATWEWNAIENASGVSTTVVTDPADHTLVFNKNGSYGIKADCNVGGGNYTVNGSALNLTPPITTLIWCGNNSHERLYVASLQNVTAYTINPMGKLMLTLGQTGDRMVFSVNQTKLAIPTVNASFVNATWRWIARAGSESIFVSSPDRYTITFDKNGTYGIKADCNTGSGNFTVNGTKVKISPSTLTKAYCGDKSFDKGFIAALGTVTAYEMDAQGRLVLLMVNAKERLVFQKVV
jgi:heat shock protein HslJ